MKFLNEVVVVLHLLGMGAIVGGWLATRTQGRISAAVLWGARAQVATGLVLVAFAEMDKDDPPNHLKIGVKLGIAVAVMACAELGAIRQRKLAMTASTPSSVTGPAARTAAPAPAPGGVASLADAAFWLTVLNVCIAVLWRSYS